MAPLEKDGSFDRRPYPYRINFDEEGRLMPVQAQNDEPWSLSYRDELVIKTKLTIVSVTESLAVAA